MRILVAQMTRMGDMIQSSLLVRRLKQQYPDAHITAMVRSMGKVIAERHPDVDDVIEYDEDKMFLDLLSEDSERLLRAYENAEKYINRLKEGNYDAVYNLTNSIASAMLLKLSEIPEVIGAHLSDDWQFVLRGRWTNYFFTSVFHRQYNDINLCDIFSNFACDAPQCTKLVFEVRDEDRSEAGAIMQANNAGEDDFVVCMQLGASENNKRWPTHHFANLARRLVEQRNAKVFLVGVESESPLGREFEEHAPGLATHLFGKTSIPQLAAILETAGVLVSNDTGTMHIAAAVDCPTVLVSIGYVHFRETGPYGPGHCAVEKHRDALQRMSKGDAIEADKEGIHPEQVMKAIDLTLESDIGKPICQIDETPEIANIDMHMTRIASDGHLQWYPVIRREITNTDLTRITYRAMWLDYLDAHNTRRAETESVRQSLSHYLPSDEASLFDDWKKKLGSAFDELAELARKGVVATEKLLNTLGDGKKLQKARELVSGLSQLDEETRIFGEMNEPAKPLVAISRFERDNLEGDDPFLLAQTSLQIYRGLFARSRLMQKKINRVAQLWQDLENGVSK